VLLCSDLGVGECSPRLLGTYKMTYNHAPAEWVAAGYFATEAEIDAVLGADFDCSASPTADAMSSGRATVINRD